MTSKLHKTPAHKQMAAIISNQHPSNINITWFYKISLVRPAQGLVYGICVCVCVCVCVCKLCGWDGAALAQMPMLM